MANDLSMKCLVVDDMLIARKNVVKTLKGLGYSNIEQAKDGVEAYSLFEAAASSGEPFGIIFSDLNMPNMSGLELVTKIRSTNNDSTPFLMITAETEQSLIIETVQAGANNYITKPFSPEDLEEKITKIFEGK